MRFGLILCGALLAGCAARPTAAEKQGLIGTWTMEGTTRPHPPTMDIRPDHTWAARVYDESGKVDKETVGEWQFEDDGQTITVVDINRSKGGSVMPRGQERMILDLSPSHDLGTTQPTHERSLFKRAK